MLSRLHLPTHRPAALALAALLLLVLALPAALAQQADTVIAEQERVIDEIRNRVEALEAATEAAAEDDAQLVEIRLELEEVADSLLQAGLAFRPHLAEVNARLEQLGPPPEEGQPAEPDIVTEERLRLLAQKGQINALIGEAEALSITASRLIEQITAMRRDLFARTLSKRYEINFTLIGEVVRDFGVEAQELYNTVASWLRFAVAFKLTSLLVATLLALIAAAIIFLGGKRLFGSLIVAEPEAEDPSYLSRLLVAFWSTLLPSIALTVFLSATYFLYVSYGVLRPDIARIMLTLFNVIAVVYFVHRLSRAALSPRLPNWRLMPVGSRAARTLVWLVFATAAINGLDYVLTTINEVLDAPLALTVGQSLAATVAVGLLVILIGTVKPFTGDSGEAGQEEAAAPAAPAAARPWPTWLRYLLYLLGGATIVSAVLGYIGLARFLSQQIVVTGAILVTMYIGFLSARALSEADAFTHTALAQRLKRRFAFDDGTLDKLGLATSIAVNLLVLVWGVPLILFQWGFQWGDIRGWVTRLVTEVHIGSVTISLVGILTGIVVFAIGYFLTRWFQSWVDGSVMARGRMDVGVRNSIKTAIGYAGLAVAALIGISAAGIDLSNLALVAGALSLGIGFGLQNIVSNFVSGLILLAERPFKAGDWIVAGQVSGTVKKISVRATEIETFQRQTIILPNSELINAAVGNWTHKNSLGRLEIPVGVAYGSDVRKVHDILMEIARGHPLVLKNPEPFILFAGFGESSLDFEIRVYLADILTQLEVLNDIRFAVVEAFEREAIEIPFPQRDIHIKSGRITAAEPDAAASAPMARGAAPLEGPDAE